MQDHHFRAFRVAKPLRIAGIRKLGKQTGGQQEGKKQGSGFTDRHKIALIFKDKQDLRFRIDSW